MVISRKDMAGLFQEFFIFPGNIIYANLIYFIQDGINSSHYFFGFLAVFLQFTSFLLEPQRFYMPFYAKNSPIELHIGKADQSSSQMGQMGHMRPGGDEI